MTSKKLGLCQGGHYNFLAGSICHQICTLSVIIFNTQDAKLKIKLYLQNALRFNFLHCFMSFHMGPKFYAQFFVSLGHSRIVPFDLSISTSKQGVCRSLICVGGGFIVIPILMSLKIKTNTLYISYKIS